MTEENQPPEPPHIETGEERGHSHIPAKESHGTPKWSHLPTVSFRKLQRKTLGQILVENEIVSEAQLLKALEKQQLNPGEKLGKILVEDSIVTEEEVLRALAYQLDLPYYARLPVNDIDPALVDQIPIQFCRDNKILPVAKDDLNVTVAVADPLNIFPLDDLRLILSTNINVIVSPPSMIDSSINRVYERSKDVLQKALDGLNNQEAGEDEDFEETRDLLESSDDEKSIIAFVSGMVSNAVRERASDIHIEPYENEIVVRFRVDGNLRDVTSVQRKHGANLSTRVKILAKLNIAEKRVPQDGRCAFRSAGKDIDVRVSVLPTAHGERIVMRLLDKSSGAKRLEDMGLDSNIFDNWIKLIEQSHGIVLVTGPTGSGKTTLLYSSLMHINRTDINIVTIEDPVEYQLPGVGQVEVKDKIGLTFNEGLRSILRQDPDVIMIGEIRDAETARIAIQSSMTGHLVFSTLHTNDTATTVTRFLDLGIQPYQVSSTVLGIMAVRLVRKICPHCREAYDPLDGELHLMGMTRLELKGRKLYRAGEGCDECHNSGYHGRVGVHELLILDEEIRDTLLRTQDSNKIKKVATDKGMKTLRESAITKVLAGLTSLEEALANTQTEN